MESINNLNVKYFCIPNIISSDEWTTNKWFILSRYIEENPYISDYFNLFVLVANYVDVI